jgi:hypothetical protein
MTSQSVDFKVNGEIKYNILPSLFCTIEETDVIEMEQHDLDLLKMLESPPPSPCIKIKSDSSNRRKRKRKV